MTYVMPLLSNTQKENEIKREQNEGESRKDTELSQLEIKDLHASIEGKEILKGVDFQVKQGEIHAIMGPNGSGKSTLASTIMGHPKYKVTKGDISFDRCKGPKRSLPRIPIPLRSSGSISLHISPDCLQLGSAGRQERGSGPRDGFGFRV